MTLASGSSPYGSLSGASSVNTQGGTNDNGAVKANHSLQVTTSAGVSAGVVTLQLSNDNVNWFSTTATVTTSAASTTYMIALAAFPAQYVRALVSTGITGGTVSATVASA